MSLTIDDVNTQHNNERRYIAEISVLCLSWANFTLPVTLLVELGKSPNVRYSLKTDKVNNEVRDVRG